MKEKTTNTRYFLLVICAICGICAYPAIALGIDWLIWVAMVGLLMMIFIAPRMTETTNTFSESNISKNRKISQLSGSRTNNTMSDTNTSNKTNFGNFVSKETDKIIKENNFTDSKDKEAAKLFAINNILHSPKALSDIYNIPVSKAKEVEEEISIKEEKKVANHIAYEGRISIKDKNRIKSLLGYKCSACGADMSEIYGDIGHNYIELHHKIPYADMKENETRTLTENEFCVLCPNCHRMIHKLPNAGDIDLLSRIIKLNKKD